MVHLEIVGERHRLSLKDWHNVLGHIDPGEIKHLEKRGLLEILDSTVASDMTCYTWCESKSWVLLPGGRIPRRWAGSFIRTSRDHFDRMPTE